MEVIYNHQGRLADDRGLWQQYAPIIRHEALRLQVRLPASVELEDLIQAGMIGLLAAIDSFDATQGTSFTTYARSRRPSSGWAPAKSKSPTNLACRCRPTRPCCMKPTVASCSL